MNLFKTTLLYAFIFLSTGCSKKNYSNKTAYQFISIGGQPDYADINYWAAHPWKWDPSDSVPAPLRKNYIKDSVVDVFFIHPTSLTDYEDTLWNANIDDSAINAKTDYTSILYQASVFNEQCRVFAPRYRQAHLRAFYSHDKAKCDTVFELAYGDIKRAFEYFLKHLNNQRPIIIAAHSQGTLHAGRILREYFEGKDLENRLVCAYLVGMPVPESYFKKIKTCTDSSSTGCFVSWRTYKRDYIDTTFISKEIFKCFVTNPLTWKTTDEYAPRNYNTGAVLKNFNKIKKNVVDAQIHNNILWTCKPRFFGNIFLHQKNYHIADINLFYTTIRENVKTRIKMFWKR
ncbi:MAG: DUF3089 domain-containing protein [Chitinophagaceae bacterium]|nr:DUF3089 domain-containing protein [Chitinophagaceae bacterium]